MKLKVVIIDDEPLSVKTTGQVLEKYVTGVELVGTATNTREGKELINTLSPDLVLLDIEMPGEGGFAMLESLPEVNFAIIFLTAHAQHALSAFKYAPQDYLLKPLDPDDVQQAVDRLLKQRKNGAKQSVQRLVVVTTDAYEVIPASNILVCSADANYTHIFLDNGEEVIVSKTLKEIESKLDEYNFFRVHHSHLVRLDKIRRFLKQDGGMVELAGGKMVPVSQRRREPLLGLLGDL